MLVLLSLVAIAHNQEGRVDCTSNITVADAAISHSYWIEDAACTFVLDTTVAIDQISVSRVDWPLEEAGTIEINSNKTKELTNVEGHIEPFAILPMWNTFKKDDVKLTSAYVTVTVHGRAFVSFGLTEDAALVFGNVVQHSYESREFVYGMWSGAMWLVHAPLGAWVLLCLYRLHRCDTLEKRKWSREAVMGLRIWLVLCCVLDIYVWSSMAIFLSSSSGGAFFIVISVWRIGMIAYYFIVIESGSRDDAGSVAWRLVGAILVLPLYLFGMLAFCKEISGALAAILGVLFAGASYAAYKKTALGDNVLYFLLVVLNTFVGIFLNIGGGIIALCATTYGYYTRQLRDHTSYSTVKLKH